MRKTLLLCLAGAFLSYAVDYTRLDKELAKQKQENILRDLRIERKTGKLRESALDRELKRFEILEEASLVEVYKSLLSAKSLPVKSSGYVGKVLFTDGIALYTGMETPFGEVNVERMKIGSLWIDMGGFTKPQAGFQSPQLPQTAPQAGAGIGPMPPPPPLPPRQPQVQQRPPAPAGPPAQVQPPASPAQPPAIQPPRTPIAPPAQQGR